MKKCIFIFLLISILCVDIPTTHFVFAVQEVREEMLPELLFETVEVEEELPQTEKIIGEWCEGIIYHETQPPKIEKGTLLSQEIFFEEEGEKQLQEEQLQEEKSKKQHTIQKTYNGLPLFSARDLHRPAKSRNVGSDTNNFGNLMEGRGKNAIGVYRSPNGRYYSVFATAQAGYDALIHEIEVRKATTLPSRLHLTAFLGGWVLGRNGELDPNSFYYNYALKRVGEDISVLQISTEVLAEIIMQGEATFNAYKKGGVDLRYLVAGESD